jgi:hypothetical protein
VRERDSRSENFDFNCKLGKLVVFQTAVLSYLQNLKRVSGFLFAVVQTTKQYEGEASRRRKWPIPHSPRLG